MSKGELRVIPIRGLPEIEPGARLGELIAEHADLTDGDVVVISQKIVSKSEGRVRWLSSVKAGEEAHRLASQLGKDPAVVQLILDESREILRADRGVLITETHHGFVCANAGIDSSNLPDDDTVCLLPADPDASARRIRSELIDAAGEESGTALGGRASRRVSGESRPRLPPTLGVVIADSFGRAWRLGQAEIAIGCAGLKPLDDWRGQRDVHGRELEATLIGIADEAAGAADLVRAKDSRVPAAIVGGLSRFVTPEDGPGAQALHRPREDDLFR